MPFWLKPLRRRSLSRASRAECVPAVCVSGSWVCPRSAFRQSSSPPRLSALVCSPCRALVFCFSLRLPWAPPAEVYRAPRARHERTPPPSWLSPRPTHRGFSPRPPLIVASRRAPPPSWLLPAPPTPRGFSPPPSSSWQSLPPPSSSLPPPGGSPLFVASPLAGGRSPTTWRPLAFLPPSSLPPPGGSPSCTGGLLAFLPPSSLLPCCSALGECPLSPDDVGPR